MIQDILKEPDVGLTIKEKVHDRDFEKSEAEIETYESIKELKDWEEKHWINNNLLLF